jgi:hypothetical protein
MIVDIDNKIGITLSRTFNMDETPNTDMLCTEKFIPKKEIMLETSHHAKKDTILLVCSQYVRVISTFH